MKKILLLSALLSMLCSICDMGATEKAKKMTIGYTDGNMGLSLGLEFPVIIRGAIYFSQSDMLRLKGNAITTLRLAISEELSQQDNYVFITDSLDGTPLYKQEVSELRAGWNDIVLDTPYEITGEELYIGFRFATSTLSLSMDGRDDNDIANYIKITEQEDDPNAGWQHQSGGSHNLQAIVEGDNLPQNDVALENIVAKEYACTQGETPISLLIRNMAAREVNSIDVEYTIEGQSANTFHIDSISVPSGEYALVPMGNIVFERNGVANLNVDVKRVNDAEDENIVDNKAMVENIVSKKDYVNRKVLLENFSTARCSNCPTAHKAIEDAMRYRTDIIPITHHSAFGTDFLTVEADEEYASFFYYNGGSGSMYAPGTMLDRTNMSPYGANDGSSATPGPAFFPQRTTLGTLIDHALSTPALIGVNIDSEYDSSSRTLSVSVHGNIPAGSVDRLKGSDIRLNIVLTEDSIWGMQVGTTDTYNYCHNHATRYLLTDTWGDALTFNGGDYKSKTYTCAIDDNWVASHMHVIAFISNYDSTDSNNCCVYNANEVDLAGYDTSGIRISSMSEGAKVEMTKGKLLVHGDCRSITIRNLSGQVVLKTARANCISTQGLASGIYIASIETPNGVTTQKITNR